MRLTTRTTTSITGTSISTPTTVASAAPDSNPKMLMAAATAGKLKEPAVLEQQVRRLLQDPRSESLARNFAIQWLHLRTLKDALGLVDVRVLDHVIVGPGQAFSMAEQGVL